MARYRPDPALKRTTRSAARASQGALPTPPSTNPAGKQQGAAPVITVDVPSTATAPPPSATSSPTTDTSSTTSSSDTTSTSEDESSRASGDADDSSIRTPAPDSTASPEVTNARIDNLIRAAERILPDPRSQSPWRHFDRTPSAPQPPMTAPTVPFSAPRFTLAWPPPAVSPPQPAQTLPLTSLTPSIPSSTQPRNTPAPPPSSTHVSNDPPAPPTTSTPRPTVAHKTLSQLRRPSPALFLGSDDDSISIGSGDNQDGDDTDRTQRPSAGQDDSNEASDSESEGRAQQSDGGHDSSGSLYAPRQPSMTALGKRRQRDETEAEASALSPPATRRRSPIAGPSTARQDVRGTLLLCRESRPPANSTTSSIRAENETLNDVSFNVDLTGNEQSNNVEPEAPVQPPCRRKRPKTRIPKKENRFPLMPLGVTRHEKKDFPKLDAPLEDGVVLAAESCPRCIKRGIHCTLGTGFHRDDRDRGKGGGRCDYCKIDGSTCTVYKGNQTARKKAYLTIAQCINHLFKLSTKRKYEEDQTLLCQIAASLETSTLNIKGEPFSLDDDDDEESD